MQGLRRVRCAQFADKVRDRDDVPSRYCLPMSTLRPGWEQTSLATRELSCHGEVVFKNSDPAPGRRKTEV